MSETNEEREPVPHTGVTRWLLLSAGVVATALGAVGAFLPVLPTTPFLLVAGACFARSSPAFHRRLLANRVFGPYLAQWRREHTVPRDAKRKAYGLVVVSFAISIAVVDVTWVRGLLAGIGLALLGFLASLPTAARAGRDERASGEPQPPESSPPRRS